MENISMVDSLSAVLSSHPDEHTPSSFTFHPLKSIGVRDQQSFAALNASNALKLHHHGPPIFQPHTLSNEPANGLHCLQSPLSDEACQNAFWSEGQSWVEPTFTSTAPYQLGAWSFDAACHPTADRSYGQHALSQSYTRQENGVPSTVPSAAAEQPSMLSQHQWPTPPPETYSAGYLPSVQATKSALHHSSMPESQVAPKIKGEATAVVERLDTSTAQVNDIPYAKLIERALREAKGQSLVLKDIYKWIERNTNKADNPAFKGWQNSVRHNLSMNGAFKKIPLPASGDKSQKGCLWSLDESAKEHGIQSTTRFRRKNDAKRIGKTSTITVREERLGRSGGNTPKRSTKLRNGGLKIRQKPSSPWSGEIDHHLFDSRSHLNHREPQSPISFWTKPGYDSQRYLPSPPYQALSPIQECSNMKDDYACMPLDPALPLSPRSQPYPISMAPGVLTSSFANQSVLDYGRVDY